MPTEPSLIEAIGRLGVAGLTRLLTSRPDLADPPLGGLADLGQRLADPHSTRVALAALTPQQYGVLVGLAAGLPPSLVARQADGHYAQVMTELADRALIWGKPPRCTPPVRAVIGPFPGGLAPALTEVLSPQQVAAALAGLGPDERAVLDRMAWGPPTGRLHDADRSVDMDHAQTPVERLLARGLLRPVDANTVLLPREVALALRGGRILPPGAHPAEAPAGVGTIDAARAQRIAEKLLTQPIADPRSVLERAAEQDRWVLLLHAGEDGRTHLDTVRVLSVSHGQAYLVRRQGRRLTVPLSRLVYAEPGGPVVIKT